MFRVFLKSKLLEGQSPKSLKKSAKAKKPVGRRRNRRVTERFSVDHKHLMLMNEQDILLVREISAKGFSTEVSERTSDRLSVGDVYEARVRYVGEIYDLDAKVSWKTGKLVGFEIVKADRVAHSFLKRLLQPIEIAASIREVNANFMSENSERKTWLHGDNGTDLYLWHDDKNQLLAWQLVSNARFVEWQSGPGLTSGSVSLPSPTDMMAGGGGVYGTISSKDPLCDPGLKQFATDLFMALQVPVKEELLSTLINPQEVHQALEKLGT